MCKEGSSWGDDKRRMQNMGKWLLSAQKTPNIVIPCCYLQKENPVKFQIIGYCDASEKAYLAVIYLKVIYKKLTSIITNYRCENKSFPREKVNHTPIGFNE